MNFLNEFIGVPLGYVVWFIYQIVQNYALSIIIFTVCPNCKDVELGKE